MAVRQAGENLARRLLLAPILASVFATLESLRVAFRFAAIAIALAIGFDPGHPRGS
jgi:hypothetical protein